MDCIACYDPACGQAKENRTSPKKDDWLKAFCHRTSHYGGSPSLHRDSQNQRRRGDVGDRRGGNDWVWSLFGYVLLSKSTAQFRVERLLLAAFGLPTGTERFL